MATATATERHRPFRADRREPTGPRSWRRTPVFVGDAVGHVDDPGWVMIVTGVLPGDRVEVVTVERVRKSPVVVHGLDDIQAALRDGRIVPRAMPRDELAPLTHGLADEVLDDSEEVSG